MSPSWGPRRLNPKKWLQKVGTVLPKSGSGYEPAFKDRSRASWPRFWGGSGLYVRRFLDDFLSFLAYFGHVFACSFLTWFSLFLVRSSTNLAKKIQELAEDKAENPRTCREQSREKNPYQCLQETQITKLSSSKLPSLSQPSLLQKLWAAVLPPGGLQYKYVMVSLYPPPRLRAGV